MLPLAVAVGPDDEDGGGPGEGFDVAGYGFAVGGCDGGDGRVEEGVGGWMGPGFVGGGEFGGGEVAADGGHGYVGVAQAGAEVEGEGVVFGVFV